MRALLWIATPLCILKLGLSLAVLAQDTKEKPAAKPKAAVPKVEVIPIYRVAELTGMPVRDTAGKDLGKIEDLVVNLGSGDVRYAAMSFGGFAGLGTKYFAIPWKALTFTVGEKDIHFVLDITKEKLKDAPGFDKNNWPDVAKSDWAAEIDKYYGVKSDANEKVTRAKPAPGKVVYDAVYRTANIKSMPVRNDAGEDLGKVEDLVIDVKQAKVRYAALSFGGVLGLGDKLFAIPWNAFRLHFEGKDKYLVLNVAQDRLKLAPGFDKEKWPNTIDPKWSMEIDRYYVETDPKAKVSSEKP